MMLATLNIAHCTLYTTYYIREPLTTADSTANVGTVDVTMANVLELEHGLRYGLGHG